MDSTAKRVRLEDGKQPATAPSMRARTAGDGSQEANGPGSGRATATAIGRLLVGKSYLLLVLVAVAIVGSALSPYFLTSRNLTSTLISISSVMVLAVGQFMVIVTGGIDLSVGSVAALSSVSVALLLEHGQSPWIALILALLIGAGVGLVNGMVIVFGGITPFIVTLAMLNVASGLAYTIQTGNLIVINNVHFTNMLTVNLFGIGRPIIIAIVVTVVAAIVMSWTPFGRRLYALGGNPEAARLSGLPVRGDTVSAYVISGLLAALSGVMLSAQLSEGSAIIGSNYELSAIAAAVVGGASLFGGRGDPISAVLGALVIGGITDIMQLRGVASQSQLLITGAVIVVAVYFVGGKGGALISHLLRGGRRRPAADKVGSTSA